MNFMQLFLKACFILPGLACLIAGLSQDCYGALLIDQ